MFGLRVQILTCFALLMPSWLVAQDPPADQRVETKQTEELPLETDDPFGTLLELPAGATLDEESRLSTTPVGTLKAEGFVFSDAAASTTSTTAALVALTAGMPLHGIGHLWMDDSRTATALLISEGAALGLMGTGALLAYADDGASSITGIAAPLFQLGFSTFVLGYLLDVVGTLQGAQLELPSNIQNRQGARVGVAYGFVTSATTSSRHFIRAQAEFDAGLVVVQADTTQSVLLASAEYTGLISLRPIRPRRQTFLHLDLGGDYYAFSETGAFSRWGLEGRLGGSLDLGTFFSQFNDVAIGLWAGYGRQFYDFDTDERSTSDFVSHRAYFHLNLTDRLNMSLGHGSHPAWLVPSITRLFGVTDLEFRYLTDFGELGFRTELGDGVGLWLGGRVAF